MKDIKKLLSKCWVQGGEGNYLSLGIDPYFIQVIAPKKGMELYIDAVSNAHLSEDDFLTEDQIKQIYELGFEDAPRSGDFAIAMPFGRDPETYANAGEKIMKLLEIYGMNPNRVQVEEVLE